MDTYEKILEKDKDEVALKIEQWDLKMESWCYGSEIVKNHTKITPTKISYLSNLKIFLNYNGSGRGAAW